MCQQKASREEALLVAGDMTENAFGDHLNGLSSIWSLKFFDGLAAILPKRNKRWKYKNVFIWGAVHSVTTTKHLRLVPYKESRFVYLFSSQF